MFLTELATGVGVSNYLIHGDGKGSNNGNADNASNAGKTCDSCNTWSVEEMRETEEVAHRHRSRLRSRLEAYGSEIRAIALCEKLIICDDLV